MSSPSPNQWPASPESSASVREYLTLKQLVGWGPWGRKAVEQMIRRGRLVRGVHYFQPSGPRTQLIFKRSAVVQLIESDGAAPRRDAGGLDVEAAKAELHRLLDRAAQRAAPAAVPVAGEASVGGDRTR